MRHIKNNYKKMLMPIVFLTLIGIITVSFPLMFAYNNRGIHVEKSISRLYIYLTGMIAFVTIYNFSILKSKRGADLFYSLPTTKRRVNIQLFIKGLIEILVSFSLVFLTMIVVINIKEFNIVNKIYFLLMFFLMIVGIITFYLFNVFVYSKANTIVDGIIMIGLYNIIVPLVINTLYLLIFRRYMFPSDAMFAIYPLIGFNNYFLFKFDISNYQIQSFNFLYYFIWIFISGGLGVFGLIYTKNQRPENIGELSNSWFSFKTLIPLVIFTITITLGTTYNIGGDILVLSIVILISYIFYVIYERSFKVKWYNALMSIVIPLAAVLINYLYIK